jgi:hypothetical protein
MQYEADHCYYFDRNIRGNATSFSMARPMWFVPLLKKTFPSRGLIAKATNIPLLGRAVDKMLFEGDDTIYLP